MRSPLAHTHGEGMRRLDKNKGRSLCGFALAHTHGEGMRRLDKNKGRSLCGFALGGFGKRMSFVIRCLSNSLESICSHLGVSFIPAGILA